MSESNSTSQVLSDKAAKPSPDFPLFAQATRRWAKKIKAPFPDFACKPHLD